MLSLAGSLLADLDVDALLERVVRAARELTGARYAAMGVLDGTRERLERFITLGIDEDTRRQIGPPPTGLGVLGELIRHPAPLRLSSVSDHPHSYGFPFGHPPMRTFLGVPILIDGKPFGNLYLTDKDGDAEFSEADEVAVVTLAEFAAIAIGHAQRTSRVERRVAEMERTIAMLEAAVETAHSLAGEASEDAVVGLIAKRSRALVEAAAVIVERPAGDGRVVAAVSGDLPRSLCGQPRPAGHSPAIELDLVFRGRTLAVLALFGPFRTGDGPTEHERRLLDAFVASAATALATLVQLRGVQR